MPGIPKCTIYLFLILVLSSCQSNEKEQSSHRHPTFERISYYNYPLNQNQHPLKFRLTYYYDNGLPHRWLELDSAGRVMTDYIYKYDSEWIQVGAKYREDGVKNYSIEQVDFPNDSTMVTEWLDSLGNIYYRMIDNLNTQGNTYRATFIGDEVHGYDSTFYTEEGFVERIFFTNVKGKIYNDRSFQYDSVNQNGDWLSRKKIMADTVSEVHLKEIFYDRQYNSESGKFLEGIVTTGDYDENTISFSANEELAILTRTDNWEKQQPILLRRSNGVYVEEDLYDELGYIYNAALSPDGDKLLYSVRDSDQEEIWLIKLNDWSNRLNLTKASGIQGGYFYWHNENEVYFYTSQHGYGDVMKGILSNESLTIVDSLKELNAINATEFSPFIDKDGQFIIFTRYEEGVPDNQGFFIAYNSGVGNETVWTIPKKLEMPGYGWSPAIISNNTQFVYTDGNDILSLPITALQLDSSYFCGTSRK